MSDGSVTSRPLAAAIIGAGLMGRWHAHAVTRAGHRVVACVDPDYAAATTLARRHDGAVPYTSLGAVQCKLDVVHVCTPLASHRALIAESLARGCHVVAEKPIGATVEEVRELLRLAAMEQRLLIPVHQFVFQRGSLEAARLLPSIGPLLHFEYTACTAGAVGRSDAEQDRVALEVLPHPLSLAARLLSMDLTAAAWTVRHPLPGELRADGTLRDVSISIVVSTHGRPTVNTLRLIGANGTVHMDLFHGFAVHLHGRATRGGKIVQPFVAGSSLVASAATNLVRRVMTREPAYPGLRELVQRFYVAVATGGAAPISPGETMAVSAALAVISNGMNHSPYPTAHVPSRARSESAT